MSILNYSTPFQLPTATPSPLNYYQPPSQHLPQLPIDQPPAGVSRRRPVNGPYSYPQPPKPFLSEDYPPLHDYGDRNRGNPLNRNFIRPSNGAGVQQHHLPEFTKVEDDGTKTNVHAVIDYDDYDEDDDGGGGGGSSGGSGSVGLLNRGGLHLSTPPVTPIQGPIYIKNGSVPVVPLYSHPVLNNGTFVQIPILWTALSVALGLELRGEYIRGVPCIKRHQALFCPKAGNSYPLDRIELFIDENKALMKRMYGEFDMGPPSDEYVGPPPSSNKKRKRSTKPGVPDLHFDPGAAHSERMTHDSFFGKVRNARQNFRTNQSSESGRVDACESKVEIVTPYWASNSAGKIRAIVNTQHFEQAIHQEVCAKARTNRCSGDCGCEQKYKWHRLLAYDPDNDCKGIFMDWFLFPSCCVCRCNPN